VLGVILALFMFFIKEPQCGAAERVKSRTPPVEKPLRKVLAIRTFWWLVMAGFAYNFATCVYTAIQDVIKPRLRATAMALFFAGLSLLGGGLGPVAVGMLSDHYAPAALLAAGASEMNEPFKAVGLHNAMYPIPAALLLTMLALLPASRCFVPDAAQMQRGMTDDMPV
jgi:MFS family permease